MRKWAGESVKWIIGIFLLCFLFAIMAPAQVSQQNNSIKTNSTTVPQINPADSIQNTTPSDDSARAQSSVKKSPQNNQPKKKATEISDVGSFWELTKLGGKVRWAIFGVLIVGLALIVQKMVELITEQYKSRSILSENIRSMTLEEINQTIDESPNTMLKELFVMLLEIFETTGQAAVFHEEIANYVNYQQDRFKTFRTRLAFLSETAGALGLLGTVWGMFQTFFGGNLDKQIILDGMGVALITTLMGLVVSIILNFFATEIFSFFNKRLEELQIKADEFRIRISRIEKSKQKKVETERRLLQQEVEISQIVPKESTAIQPSRQTFGPPFKLVYIAGDDQSAIVNSRLENPLIVELLDAYDNRLHGQVIRFSVEQGDGSLSNGGKIQEIVTDKEGRALTFLTTGTKAGKNIVRTIAQGLNGHFIEFVATGKAGQPETMTLSSGNNLAGIAGTPLQEPFVIAVRDAFNNPIPNFQVIFKVSMGNGYFAGKTTKYSVITDASGLAQAYFTLGTKKGFNRITVTAKKLRRAKIEIQALGQ